MEQNVIQGATGAAHLVGAPLTTTVTNDVAPGLLTSDIDSRIVKVRPMATPIDQISRLGAARRCKSMVAEYYSVDTMPTESTLTSKVSSSESRDTYEVSVMLPGAFSVTETVLIPQADWHESGMKPGAVFYITAINGDKLSLRSIGSGTVTVFPELHVGDKIIRMGRAAAELDVQTTQAQAVPKKNHNNCQIFKAQVEESHLQSSAAKEVGWTLSDQEEVAIIDMRMGMEKSFLFGKEFRFDKGAGYGEVFMTEGIWHQTVNDFKYTRGELTAASLVKLSRQAFTGCGASSRKVLVAGSGLIEALSSLDTVKTLGATQTVTRWGIDFTEIHTKFGRLYVVLSEVFDACGHSDDGMIIDPEYLQKYVHVPFRTTPIDMSKSGQRNTKAVILTEASCLVLRYPTAHVRVIAQDAPQVAAPDAGGADDDDDENSFS